MNGLLDNQTSGNDWETPIHAMLHQRGQDAPPMWPTAKQRSIIQDFEQQMEDFEHDYREHVDQVRKLYVLPSDTSVLDFLNDHRALPQLLIAAIPRLRRLFPDAVFALRATSDQNGWQNLYTDVLWPGDAIEALRLIDQFEDEWWIANSHFGRGSLTFTYRLV